MPIYLKIIPVIVGLYLLSPLDLIPGFLPIIGQLDDFGLLLVGLSTFIRLAQPMSLKNTCPPTWNWKGKRQRIEAMISDQRSPFAFQPTACSTVG